MPNQNFTTAPEFVREVLALIPSAETVYRMIDTLETEAKRLFAQAANAKSRQLAECAVRLNSKAILFEDAAAGLRVAARDNAAFLDPRTIAYNATV